MKKKYILFDFDGTLADSYPLIIRIINGLSPVYHFRRISALMLRHLRQEPLPMIYKDLGVSILKAPFLLKRIIQEYDNHILTIQPFPEMDKVLAHLKAQHYHIGIVTLNSIHNVQLFLNHHRLDPYIDFIQSSSLIFGKKHTFAQLMKQHRFTPKQVLYIGDEIRDIKAAHAVHWPCIAVTWGFNAQDFLQTYHPTYVVDHPQQLVTQIQTHFNTV